MNETQDTRPAPAIEKSDNFKHLIDIAKNGGEVTPETFMAAVNGVHDLSTLAHAINTMADIAHGCSYAAGWWSDDMVGDERDFAIRAALIHSEISEALEAHRKNLMDSKLPHRHGIEVELADAVIRIMDLAGAYGLDLGGAIVEKLDYNTKREDHKIEHRKGKNGKLY